jgi:hypothetical protein
LLRHGGVLVVHHALLGGAVADPGDDADETLTVRDVLAAVADDWPTSRPCCSRGRRPAGCRQGLTQSRTDDAAPA